MAEAAAPRARPWLAWSAGAVVLFVLAWASAAAAALWFALEADARRTLVDLLAPRAGVLVLFVLLLPLGAWLLVRPFVAAWPRAAARLRDEVRIVAAAHAGHRPSLPEGAPELRELATAVAEMAAVYQALRTEVDVRIGEARARLADETRRLAALMSELPQGVLVCNREGRVLLYNARADELLGAGAPAADAAPLGLGRPLGALLDGGALEHARHLLERRQQQGQARPAARLVVRAAGSGALLRVQMVPVGSDTSAPGGSVLIVDDITRTVDDQSRRDALLQRLTEGLRTALANLRAAAQTLQQYPAMDAARRERLTGVVHDEAERLARQLDAALHADDRAQSAAWPREEIRVADLVEALQRSLVGAGGEPLLPEGDALPRWLEADSHALVQLSTQLALRAAAELGVQPRRLCCLDQGRFVRLDLCWDGSALEPATLSQWEAALLAPAVGGGARLRDVLDRHGAELWPLRDPQGRAHRLCLQLPAAGAAEGPADARAPGRPIAYDFDLFHQAGQTAALDETPLAALAYTVFDTETTGLRPSEGDEIIAIGAVRIVNQRLLEHEHFDRLVRPRRPVKASAQAIHGLSTRRLESEPPLEQVLPGFARFCDGTVLVAHNAAFDMRFLEIARERTGVRFDQPVLDTLLLAAAVQPGHGAGEHHLEQIAARLGVPVQGRHQALGDAQLTAGVFLKLLPLLAERGVVTLGQAREASMRTPEARERF